jgi:hypothetical protein
MKKYLMTGVAALAICAAFTSCSKSEELFDQGAVNQNQANQVVEQYNQAFLKYVGGKIATNQTWGFGGYAAGTRAGGKWASYSGAEPNGHLWTSYGFHAPDALSDGQKLRVQYYFQMNKITNPNQPKNLAQDFFMQQVYDGATDPITQDKYGKVGNYSPEVYVDGAGNTINSGEHMDKLTAGSDHEHVNNFNNSNYPNPITNVANWNQTVQDDPNQEHEDQIMLMLNTKTDCFGYLDSNNSVQYDDQWTLVSSATIDDFCENIDPTGYQAFLEAHPGIVDAVVNDTWGQRGRGFIGFDFKLMPDPDPISPNEYAVYNDADGSQWNYVYNGTSIITVDDKSSQILINGSPIPVVIDNTNFYGGDVKGVGGQDGHSEFDAYKDYVAGGANNDCLYLKKHTTGVQEDHVAINLKFIERMVTDGYLPVHGKHLKLWVKVSDLTDGFYSDWIVSYMAADYNPPVDPEDVCIIAEDLNANSATDFDFNDVVFTVHYTSNNSATVTVYAAGATQPILIGSETNEVHQLFAEKNNDPSLAEKDPKTGLYKMINTGAKADVNGLALPTFTVTSLKSSRGSDITIMVNKLEKNAEGVYEDKGNWITLTANGGEPAAKLCVGADYATEHKWCEERESIREKYPLFYQWVSEHPTLIWWR